MSVKKQNHDEDPKAPADPVDLSVVADLIPLREAAALIGLSPASLQKYAVQGRLQARKMGRDWFTTPEAARAYLESRRLDRVPNRKK